MVSSDQGLLSKINHPVFSTIPGHCLSQVGNIADIGLRHNGGWERDERGNAQGRRLMTVGSMLLFSSPPYLFFDR